MINRGVPSKLSRAAGLRVSPAPLWMVQRPCKWWGEWMGGSFRDGIHVSSSSLDVYVSRGWEAFVVGSG